MLHFLFPSDPFDEFEVDGFFGEQKRLLTEAGFSTSVFADDVIKEGKRSRRIPEGSSVVYRGWMFTADEYAALTDAITQAEGIPFTTVDEYLLAHHLLNWYPRIQELTPETRVFPADCDIAAVLESLNWGSYFIKDYVKSLKTSRGAIVHDSTEAAAVLAEMREYRGEIEGGICVRRVEDFIKDTERRFFVINGRPFASNASDEIPDIVATCSARIPSKFFSVDIVKRTDGTLRIVEVGDGQVSDLVGWTPQRFAEIWKSSAV